MTSCPFEILSVNVSTGKGTSKKPVGAAAISADGIEGDAHCGYVQRHVSLLAAESIEKFGNETGRNFGFGDFAENLTTGGLMHINVYPLDKLSVADAVLEVTQVGKACHGGECEIFRSVGACIMPKEGIFARVLKPGNVAAHDTGNHFKRGIAISVITVSDRAYGGEYEDASGPKAAAILDDYFSARNWRVSVAVEIVPDDRSAIESALDGAIGGGADIVVSTGGTGIGPRDVTPDAVSPLITRPLPGIMNSIRQKYGAGNPNALLSRAVAGANGKCLIYTLPGSVRAVAEYLSEITLSLEHAIYMLHGLDVHSTDYLLSKEEKK